MDFNKLLEIADFNETAIMALEKTNIADVLPVITVLKDIRKKIELLKEDAERSF